MSEVEFTHMTSKGQIVIPSDIRKEADASDGTVFAVFGSGGTIMLKKIQTPSKEDFRKDWSKLVEEGNKKVKKLGVKEKDVNKIIQARRSVKHA